MVTNTQVAYCWANQTKKYLKGSNFFFSGKKIYSYSERFLVGLLVNKSDKDKKKYTIALINNSGRSMSTRRHCNWALVASNHLKRFYIPNIGITPDDIHANCRYFLDQIIKYHDKSLLSFKYNWYKNLDNNIECAVDYINTFPTTIVDRDKIMEWKERKDAGILFTKEQNVRINARIEGEK